MEKEVNELTSKFETRNLDQLEKNVHALTLKVLSLENKREVMKNKPETVKQMSIENCLNKEPSFNASEVKESSSPSPLKTVQKICCPRMPHFCTVLRGVGGSYGA